MNVKGKKHIWVFTPSRSDPKDLELILVQRHKLLADAVERVRESVQSAHKHHLLFVGPRGCGKTHLVTLIVSRLQADPALKDRMRIAWLSEDETCTSFRELLLKIHTALARAYPEAYRSEMLAKAYDLGPEAAEEYVQRQLLATLASRTLVVVAENLDAIFGGLGQGGQKRLRAFIQENSKLAIVATAQRLVADLSNRASPFFGFFQTEHLTPLNVEEATLLLQKLAQLHQMGDVAEFLATGRGRAGVRALHHLSGGNHRIYIVLSQFITQDSVDDWVGPFMQMVDELTPYYQERIRWLPPLQRKIIECLYDNEGTMPVKEIAKRLFATHQTISSQLQDLREKGYVTANQRGRESLYEISEPMMRICIGVKDHQRGQPIRLLVDFLRVWYDARELSPKTSLTAIPFIDGKWDEGLQTLAAGLEAGARAQAPHFEDTKSLIDVIFTAGLSPESRAEKMKKLLGIYKKHQALLTLGVAMIEHIGAFFQKGPPFPSTDNLEGWALAWEQAAAGVPDFCLAVRLLRSGVDFIKAGGKDPGPLLILIVAERTILEQTLELAKDR